MNSFLSFDKVIQPFRTLVLTMSFKIYSVIRCTGSGAYDCIRRQMFGDDMGIYGDHKIDSSENDQIIWFSVSHDDFGDHITEEFLLNKLQELGSFRRISGTIKC